MNEGETKKSNNDERVKTGDIEKEKEIERRLRQLGLWESKRLLESRVTQMIEAKIDEKDGLSKTLKNCRRRTRDPSSSSSSSAAASTSSAKTSVMDEIRNIINPRVIRDCYGQKLAYHVNILMGCFTKEVEYEAMNEVILIRGSTAEDLNSPGRLTKEIRLELPVGLNLSALLISYAAGAVKVRAPYLLEQPKRRTESENVCNRTSKFTSISPLYSLSQQLLLSDNSSTAAATTAAATAAATAATAAADADADADADAAAAAAAATTDDENKHESNTTSSFVEHDQIDPTTSTSIVEESAAAAKQQPNDFSSSVTFDAELESSQRSLGLTTSDKNLSRPHNYSSPAATTSSLVFDSVGDQDIIISTSAMNDNNNDNSLSDDNDAATTTTAMEADDNIFIDDDDDRLKTTTNYNNKLNKKPFEIRHYYYAMELETDFDEKILEINHGGTLERLKESKDENRNERTFDENNKILISNLRDEGRVSDVQTNVLKNNSDGILRNGIKALKNNDDDDDKTTEKMNNFQRINTSNELRKVDETSRDRYRKSNDVHHEMERRTKDVGLQTPSDRGINDEFIETHTYLPIHDLIRSTSSLSKMRTSKSNISKTNDIYNHKPIMAATAACMMNTDHYISTPLSKETSKEILKEISKETSKENHKSNQVSKEILTDPSKLNGLDTDYCHAAAAAAAAAAATSTAEGGGGGGGDIYDDNNTTIFSLDENVKNKIMFFENSNKKSLQIKKERKRSKIDLNSLLDSLDETIF